MSFFYFFLLLFCGCENTSVNEKTLLKKDKEFIDVCRRIGKLDMTAVAISSGILEQSAVQMRILVKKFGLRIPDQAMINKDIFASADTDDHRLYHLIEAVHSNHKIIWAIRGGYGTARLLAALDLMPKPSSSKTFVGFSDVTALHLFISQKWPNWRVIHASVLTFLDRNSFENKFDILLDILENKIDSYDLNGVCPLNDIAMTARNVVGKLTGGNLSIIVASLGTCWEIKTAGKILFLEDTHEYPERLYRMLYHLKESDKLSNVRALVLGHFHIAGNPERLLLFLKGFAKTLNIPVYVTDKF